MSQDYREIEVKFCVGSLAEVEARLVRLGARLAQPRVLERNLRFDTPMGDLARTAQVLRLRQDTAAHLTYKGAGRIQEGVQARTEIEFVVEDFDLARAFLEALGYQLWVVYEKYRTTYALGATLVTLDELPLGSFVEIEGPTPGEIAAVARQLALDWEKRLNLSYLALFNNARQTLGFAFRDLTFENFKTLKILPSQFGAELAD